jgi:hypothetical protein
VKKKLGAPRRYNIKNRKSKVGISDLARPYRPGATFRQFCEGLPKQLAAIELREVARSIAKAHNKGRPVIAGFGGHVIKVGLGPILVDLIDRGILTALCTNGAGMIHDFELAYAGKTSEDVDSSLKDGTFGFALQTGRIINEAVLEGAEKGLGIGEAVGNRIIELKAPHLNKSVFAGSRRRKIPLTVHVALGTDIVHMHPEADGAAWGKAGFIDFNTLCEVVAGLEGGVFLNLGSAVILPEVFLKAVTAARNRGRALRKITTVDMDFIRQYRPQTNVVRRPTALGGRGVSLVGHHEIMIPLLFAAVLEELSGG